MLCEYAKKSGISCLYDEFEADRLEAISVFKQVGFQVIEHTHWKKFHKEVEGVLLKIELV